MLELGDQLNLAEEAVGPNGLGHNRLENLDGYRAAVTEILAEVDDGHATAAQLTLDSVAFSERRVEPCSEVVAHGILRIGGSGR